MKVRNVFGTILGAFADGAILFPLLAALSVRNGFSGWVLLGTSGLAYCAAGFIFRVPMSVQPLKSIAIAALAVGASSTEVRISGALLAVLCLLLLLFNVERIAEKVPQSLVHGLQVGLGVILILQGVTFSSSLPVFALVAVTALSPIWIDLPVLGIVAVAGLVWGLMTGADQSSVSAPLNTQLRVDIIAALVFPQLALTLTNSVLATRDVCRSYFGEKAYRVTVRRLLTVIGLGNLLTAAAGGLPFCHGSGGVTAHVRGGAKTWHSNLVIGSTLIAFAAIEFSGSRVRIIYPPVLMAALLMTTGIFHIGLAKNSFMKSTESKITLVMMAITAFLTRNMLLVLAAGGVVYGVSVFLPRAKAIRKAR